MTTITLNTTPQQDRLITKFLSEHPEAQESLLDTLISHIEDLEDYQAGIAALASYNANGQNGYSLKQTKELLGL
ncbi:hypothetical protein Javan174_0005 [Streptococcus phage Javan174]|uniref:hypothetical protein n=1 Tax=Streptococcus entericus TaxID=155680 RepID=UPI00036B47A5|nr:hypothetical protein [Streptococcus entericus]QBX24071.1 hypothetical protein Javan174_0005 [Streptococcus phage Javan174]